MSCLPPQFSVSILDGVQSLVQRDEASLGEFASVRWLLRIFSSLSPFLLSWGGAWRLLVVPAASVAGGGVKIAGRAALWLPIPHWTVGCQFRLNGSVSPNAQLRVLHPYVDAALHGAVSVLPAQQSGLVFGTQSSGGVSSFGYSGTIVHTILASGKRMQRERRQLAQYQRHAYWWRARAPDGDAHQPSPAAEAIGLEAYLTQPGSIGNLSI